jgi:queuine tRNA-ribosyltransferase
MFDCVMPTRSGRHGQAFTRFGRLNLRNAKFAEDHAPARRGQRLPGAVEIFRAPISIIWSSRARSSA